MCSSQAPSIPCEGGTEADSQAHRAAELYLNANSHRETLMPMIRNAGQCTFPLLSLGDLCLLPQIKVTATSPVSGLFICLFICQEQKSTHTITLEIRALCHGHGRNSVDAGLPHSQLQGGVAQISCCTPDFVIDAHSMDSTRAQRQIRECSRIKGWAIRPT